MPYEQELAAALEAARQASRHIAEAYAVFEAIPDARADISTDADVQSQEIILAHLHVLFPADGLCAEERTPTLQASPAGGARLWIVDPIDGTRGFAQKNGEFSVMIALVEGGQVVVGVVQEPATGRLTYAVRGGGCWARDGDSADARPCRVSATTSLEEAVLAQSRSRHPGVPSRQARALRPARVDEMHSAGVKLVRVARGEADLYVNHYPNFHDWDIAAGHLLVEEAGGTVTGLAGQPIRYGSPGAWQRVGLLASNGLLHESALARLRDW
jgi:3'(2'), 5'-bisphosphate nucleotidase